MSKVILSYSLFDQKDKKFDRSGHDPFNKNANRYWTNIPFILIVNKLCIPNSETYLYVPKDLENNPMYFFLDLLNQNGHINLKVIDKPHSGTEPTIWRMKALWENADFCFCRDIDSVLSPSETKSMLFFMDNQNYWIHNIRSVKQHNVEGTSIMAGLCGFNTNDLKAKLPLPNSFEKYENFYKQLSKKSFFLDWRTDLKNATDKNGHWGCDQETLLTFFIKTRSQRVISKILDTYSQPGKRVSRSFKGIVKPNKYYKINSIDISSINENYLSNINKQALAIMDKAIAWSGQPINTSGTILKELLTLPIKETNYIKRTIQGNNMLKRFYF